jgi:tetratricopeptide (TPR) repeat protein
MNIKTIKDIAYTINYCKKNNKPMPIVLCGAGISITAGIPGTNTIIENVYDQFAGKSEIEKLKSANCTDYYTIMRALRAEERQDLFKGYIESDNVRLNLASIYIAQLLKAKYVDFVFTVNFDDVLLKSSALFNFIPPIYDLANISELNSNSFIKNSLVYLHGQYYGQWLLNTEDEIQKGLQNVHNLFQRECNRPWIVVGYSGEDEIFKKLNEIPSFSSDLYWVSKDDDTINKEVKNKLLEQPNKNAYLISNIDADTFFLELCTELKLDYPPIFDKPFTFLESYFDKIQDFKTPNENYKTIYQNLSKQKEISLNWIKEAKEKIEKGKSLEHLQQEIIDAIIKNDFSKEIGENFEQEIKKPNFSNAKEQLSWYYNDWGIALKHIAKLKQDEYLFNESFKKYKKASELNSKDESIYNNWGNALFDLAKLKQNENLYFESLEKYKQASELNPKNDSIYNNWGNALSALAKLKQDENIYFESFEKYKQASELNPKNDSIYYNWGNALFDLAKLKQNENLYFESALKYKQASELNPKNYAIYNNWGSTLCDLAKIKKEENLYFESFEKYKQASELNSKDYSIYYNWGIAFSELAKLKQDENLYFESALKYKQASELNPKNDSIYNNWGNALSDLAKIKQDENLYFESAVKYKQASELNPKNDSIYYNWGIALSDLAKLKHDENLFFESFEKYKQASELNPKDDSIYYNWGIALSNLAKIKQDENLFFESFEKYKQASELNPKDDSIYYNWGSTLCDLAKIKQDENLWKEAEEILRKGIDLGGKVYNLACFYALRHNKEKAFVYLKQALDIKEVTATFVEKDEDWKDLINEIEFQNLLNK